MNEDDSNSIKNFLLSYGLKEEESEKNSDIIIINTCTVRQHAEDKALSFLGSLKKISTNKKIFFIGCAAERLGEKIKNKFPYISYVIGAKSYQKIYEILRNELYLSDHLIQNTFSLNSKISDYQTISRGCNMKCSYCIVPDVRGMELPVPFEKIIGDIKKKAKNGVREIILLGQTVNSYIDKQSSKKFIDLLKEISKIDEIKIIRFLSPHPVFFNDEFFEEYKKNHKISRWIHLPLQSGSDKILKKMRRGYTIEKFKKVVDELRRSDPTTSITTDIIVGYTDETEEDFNLTLAAIREIKFSMVYCFKYSPRFKDKDQLTITNKELEKRHQVLLNEVKKIAKELMYERIGKTEEVLIYSKNKGITISGYNCCIIDCKNMKEGDIYKVKIENVKNNTLYGRAI